MFTPLCSSSHAVCNPPNVFSLFVSIKPAGQWTSTRLFPSIFLLSVVPTRPDFRLPLPTPLSRHKSCRRLTSSLSVCLYSLFVAEEQSILFKETPEKWDICLSTHTITRRGIIIMDAHGLVKKKGGGEMDVYFPLGFRLFDWTDE